MRDLRGGLFLPVTVPCRVHVSGSCTCVIGARGFTDEELRPSSRVVVVHKYLHGVLLRPPSSEWGRR